MCTRAGVHASAALALGIAATCAASVRARQVSAPAASPLEPDEIEVLQRLAAF